MKEKLINFYETVMLLVFVLSLVMLVAVIFVGALDMNNEASLQKIEVQSTYVKDTFYDKTQQAGFDLSNEIDKERYQDYYVKGKDLTTNKRVELPITKAIYDNINSLNVKKIIYDSKEQVKVYNKNYQSDFDEFYKIQGLYSLIACLVSGLNLWFLSRKEDNSTSFALGDKESLNAR